MSTSNFAAKLNRELKRNPKKTAVLALLCAVALWFWAPLVWKWFAPASAAVPEQPTAAASTTTTTPATTTIAISTTPQPELSWKNLTELFTNHQLMKTAQLRREAASPFEKMPSSVRVG